RSRPTSRWPVQRPPAQLPTEGWSRVVRLPWSRCSTTPWPVCSADDAVARRRDARVMTAPRIARTRAELHDLVTGSGTVAFVPTMGALHRGHAALLDDARPRADRLVASIFVNPLQFAPGEDLERYPRTFDADVELCVTHGVDVVFAPSVDEVYPGGEPAVTVEPGPLGTVLEGASRPGHFRGVLTVVAKLFGLVAPDVAVFGEKDYQQLVLIRRMTSDLC